jgi:hypothetical protein
MPFGRIAATAALCAFSVSATLQAAPRVVLISLDGATPALVNQFVRDGTLPLTVATATPATTTTTTTRSCRAPMQEWSACCGGLSVRR